MRIPVAVTLESRDGSVSKDAKVTNALVESVGGTAALRKRPGHQDLGLIHAGTAQLLYSWNGLNAMIGDSLYRGDTRTIVSGPGTTAFTPSIASLRFDAQEVGNSAATQRLMVKNRTQAWVVDQTGAKTAITFPAGMGTATYSVATLTRTGSTATASLALDPGLSVGDSITVAGAGQAAYNITATVTAVTPYSSTPATTVSISSLTRSSTTATAVTATPHGLTNGNAYAMSGAAQAAYNITATVTVVDGSTFTYPVTVTAAYSAYGAGVTWNASDKSALIALSGGNLTASLTASGNTTGSVRATTGVSSGVYVWEVTVSSTASQWFVAIGVADATFNVSGSQEVGNASGTWGASLQTTAAVYGVRLDMGAGTVSIFRNGVLFLTQSGVTGTVYPCITLNVANFSSGTVTAVANFGATAFVYSAEDPATPATGSPIVTVSAGSITSATVSYTVAGTPTTPATGTITLTANFGTVPGIPYIDGYFFVMDRNAVMWQSNSDDPTTWNALNFNTAQSENGTGKAMGRFLNYLVAYKEFSTEFFVDQHLDQFAFAPVGNAFLEVGCASGESLASLESSAFWISQTRANGRGVHMLQGVAAAQKISTADVDRILALDTLSTLYAYTLTADGHRLYLLTLVNTGITLVYDVTSQVWSQWTTLTIGASVSVTSIVAGLVTTPTAHGLNDGDPVKLLGTNEAAYVGIFQAQVVSTTQFRITDLGTATGTVVAYPYTSSYFKFTKYCDYQGQGLLLHESDGHLYSVNSALYQDAGAPIDVFLRTTRLDGGAIALKGMSRMVAIGDAVNDVMMFRHSDDDSATFTKYRRVDLSLKRPSLRRMSGFRRRTIEGRYIGNNPLRLAGIELEIS